MERSRQCVRDQVAYLAFGGRVANEIERARISMVARNSNVPFKGRIQMRKTNHLQIVIFGLQRAAGPYRWANSCLDETFVALRYFVVYRFGN